MKPRSTSFFDFFVLLLLGRISFGFRKFSRIDLCAVHQHHFIPSFHLLARVLKFVFPILARIPKTTTTTTYNQEEPRRAHKVTSKRARYRRRIDGGRTHDSLDIKRVIPLLFCSLSEYHYYEGVFNGDDREKKKTDYASRQI